MYSIKKWREQASSKPQAPIATGRQNLVKTDLEARQNVSATRPEPKPKPPPQRQERQPDNPTSSPRTPSKRGSAG